MPSRVEKQIPDMGVAVQQTARLDRRQQLRKDAHGLQKSFGISDL